MSSSTRSAGASSETRICRAFGKHALLAGGQATLTLASPEVANNLGNLQHIAGVELLEIGFVPRATSWSAPRCGCAKDTENPFQTVSVYNVTDPNKVQVARRYTDDEITLTNNPQYEIELVFTLDLPGFNVLDDGGPMIGVEPPFRRL